MKCSLVLLGVTLGLAACDDQRLDRPTSLPTVGAAAPDDTTDDTVDAGAETSTPADASSPGTPACTTTFGHAITPQFGRLDATVRIVITPGLRGCKSDNDHVIVQLDVDEGGATVTYPVVINIFSDLATNDPAVRFGQTGHTLIGAPWAKGWHTNVSLDYGLDLGMHSAAFTPKTKAELGALITAALPKGTKVSAYMQGFDTADGGHKVHRNSASRDGALVVVGSAAPSWLLFQFSNQIF